MRTSLTLASTVGLALASFLHVGCSSAVSKGYHLPPQRVGSFTYSAGSTGSGPYLHETPLVTTAMIDGDAPYGLRLRIRPDDQAWKSIELLSARAVRGTDTLDLMPMLEDRTAAIETSSANPSDGPRAAFFFKKGAIPFEKSFTLELAFTRHDSPGKVHRVALLVPFSSKRHYLWLRALDDYGTC